MMKTCLDYHEETSYDRNRMGGHFMDWANQPSVFKNYEGREPILLPRDVELPRGRLSKLLAGEKTGAPGSGMDPVALSKLLLLTYTFTAQARAQDGSFYFRSAASAGALYPTELYAALQGVETLENGIYHYAIHHHGLVPLRKGEFGDPGTTLFLTAIFFRSAWKYRARAYRYHLLDTGHVVENLLLALRSNALSCRVSYDFDDDRVNDLLGLDANREVTLAAVSLPGEGAEPEWKKGEIPILPEAVSKASRVSQNELDYPAIRDIHDAGKVSLKEPSTPLDMPDALGVAPQTWKPFDAFPLRNGTADYPDCVFTRRSKRNFVKKPISKDAMAELLSGISSSGWSSYDRSVSVGFLNGRVEEMAQGFYLLDPAGHSAGLVSAGSFIEGMTRICLDQGWLVNAGIHFLFLANLDLVDRTWGPRGYRYAMMTAGRLGQRLYVAATALGLGCCGIGALYDEEARVLLGLNEGSRLLYLVAVGVVKKA